MPLICHVTQSLHTTYVITAELSETYFQPYVLQACVVPNHYVKWPIWAMISRLFKKYRSLLQNIVSFIGLF